MQLQSSILGRLDSELPGAICRDLGNPPCTPTAKRDRSNRPTSSREHEPHERPPVASENSIHLTRSPRRIRT
jgi:hypothetical protein